jgi:hypothetical protein|tara:strand:- start:262 stop:588 length:327 start_codon:yes stop_codon:yes gene_type:complete
METRNDLDYANSQPNENELEKERLVTISNRSVYHKYAEVTIPLPKHIKQEDVAEWLFENEHLYTDDLDQRMSEASYDFGFGLGNGMDEKDEESEWRYDIEGEKYGGHL